MDALNPEVKRKQISVYKFNRIKNSSHSKRVRVFLSLYPYTITVVIEGYLHGDHLYAFHGVTKPDKHSLAKRKSWVYSSNYYRYEINSAVYLMGEYRG